MRYWAFLSLSIIVFFGCSSDDTLEQVITDNRISSIEHGKGSGNPNQQWTEEFVYGSNKQLISVNNWRRDGRIDLDYDEGDRLQDLRTQISGSSIVYRDSFSYNSSNQIDRIFRFTINVAEEELETISQYIYDADGKLIEEKLEIDLTGGGIWTAKKFYWEGENIIRYEEIRAGNVLTTVIYEYDDKPNYKRTALSYINDPEYNSLNNVIKMEFQMGLGGAVIVDHSCNPCFTEYKYNSRDLPKKITQENLSAIFLKYE